ncbi:MAG: hypothetical protein JXB48_15290 [Candidatus Latescibacteria bacterium]|nr:hypothetical protein [Candidatus Latescibacterota bacterium]
MKSCLISCLFILIAIFFVNSCSKDIASYDQLVQEGRAEEIARKKYDGFFKAVNQLTHLQEFSDNTHADSVLIKKAAEATDKVIADVRSFPQTVDSRLAFDALSYAANELSKSVNFVQTDVSTFWENALLDPLLVLGNEFVKSKKLNESAHLQIVTALQRGMGTKATSDMLVKIIPIVGPTPSHRVMEVCGTDSLVFKRIFDLIYYSRSLQAYGPPLWMTTGSWFVALKLDEWPVSFFCFKPVIADEALYLTFRNYDQGTVYASVFDDPIPKDPEKTDTWLVRAGAVMESFNIDDELAERISKCDLPVYNTHNYYNDYLIHTAADSVKKEFTIILKRERLHDSPFEFSGTDSITVQFTTAQIEKSEGLITKLAATRVMGAAMSGGRMVRARRGEGFAYLIPMGKHDDAMLRKIREDSLPEIKINTK